MAEFIHVQSAAGQLAIIAVILFVWWDIRRLYRSPMIGPADFKQPDLPAKKVVTHPGGQFVVKDKGRDAVANDDDTVWERERERRL